MGAVLWSSLSVLLSSIAVGGNKESNGIGFLPEVSWRSEMELGLYSEL